MLPLHSSFLYFMQTSDPTFLDPLAISLFKEMASISSLWKTSSPFFVQEITACVDLEVDATISLRQITKQSCRAMLSMENMDLQSQNCPSIQAIDQLKMQAPQSLVFQFNTRTKL